MDIAPFEIRHYQTASGKRPFQRWMDSLDVQTQLIVDVRLARVRRGLFGDAKSLGGGIFELKIDIGPGYRIYYGRDGKTIVILLQAGDKKGQSSDIKTAKAHWDDYLRRSKR